MTRLRRDLVLRWACCPVEIGAFAREHAGHLSATPEESRDAHRRFIHDWTERAGRKDPSLGWAAGGPPPCWIEPRQQPVLCDTDGRVVGLLDARAVETPSPVHAL